MKESGGGDLDSFFDELAKIHPLDIIKTIEILLSNSPNRPIALRKQQGILHCTSSLCFISTLIPEASDQQILIHLDAHKYINAVIPKVNVLYVDNEAKAFRDLPNQKIDVFFDACYDGTRYYATLIWTGEKPKEIALPDEDSYLCLENKDVEVSMVFIKEQLGIVTLDIENNLMCVPFNKNCVMFNGKKASGEEVARLHKSNDYSGLYASISVMMKGSQQPCTEYVCMGLWMGQKPQAQQLTPREVYVEKSECKFSLHKDALRIYLDIDVVFQYKEDIMTIHFIVGKEILCMRYDLSEQTATNKLLRLLDGRENGVAHVTLNPKVTDPQKKSNFRWGIAQMDNTEPSPKQNKSCLVYKKSDPDKLGKDTSITHEPTDKKFKSAVVNLNYEMLMWELAEEVKQALECSSKTCDSPEYCVVGGELTITRSDADCTFKYHHLSGWKELVVSPKIVIDLIDEKNETTYAFVIFQNINKDDSNDGLGKPLLAWLMPELYRHSYILPNQKLLSYDSSTKQVHLKGKGDKNSRACICVSKSVFLQTSHMNLSEFVLRHRNTPLHAVVLDMPLETRTQFNVQNMCLFATKDLMHAIAAFRAFHLNADLSYTLSMPPSLKKFMKGTDKKKKTKKKKSSKAKSSSPEPETPRERSRDELCMEDICRQFSSLRNEALKCMEGQHFHTSASKFKYGSTLHHKKVHMVDHTDGLALLHSASDSQYIIVQLSDIYYKGWKATSFKELEKHKTSFHCVTTAIDDTVFRDHRVTELAMVAWVCGGPPLLSVHECDFHEAVLYVTQEETQAITSLSKALHSDIYSQVPAHLLPLYCNIKQMEKDVLLCQEGITSHPCKNHSLYKKSLEVTEAKIEYVDGNIIVLASIRTSNNIWCHLSDVYVDGQKLEDLAQLQPYMIKKRPLTTVYSTASATTLMQGDVCYRGLLVYESGSIHCLPELHMCSSHVGFQVSKASAYERQVIEETLLVVKTLMKQDNLCSKYYTKVSEADLRNDSVRHQKDRESAGSPCRSPCISPTLVCVSPAPPQEKSSTVDPLKAGSRRGSQSSSSEEEVRGNCSSGEARSRHMKSRETNKASYSQSPQAKVQNAQQSKDCSGRESRQFPSKTTVEKTTTVSWRECDEGDLPAPAPANYSASLARSSPVPVISQSKLYMVSVTPEDVSKIEYEHCLVTRATPMMAVMQGKGHNILIYRDDFLFRGKKIDSSVSFRNFLYAQQPPIHVYHFKASQPLIIFSEEVSHIGILAHVETKIEDVHTVLDTWKQNPVKVFKLKSNFTKQDGNLLQPIGNKVIEVKGKICRTWQEDGAISVMQPSDAGNLKFCGYAWFRDKVVTVNGNPLYKSVRKLANTVQQYNSVLFSCTVQRCVPENLKGIVVEYIVRRMSIWLGRKEENMYVSMPERKGLSHNYNKSGRQGQQNTTQSLTSNIPSQNKHSTYNCVSGEHSTSTTDAFITKSPPQKLVYITDHYTTKSLNADGQKVDGSPRSNLISASPPLKEKLAWSSSTDTGLKQGVITDLYSTSGVLVGEDGRSTLFFSRDHCYLYGVPLHSLQLWHVLTLGLKVEYEVNAKNSVCRVNVCEPLTPETLISRIAEWCDDNNVPEETAVALANTAFNTICVK